MEKIIVTGGTGYIGSHTCIALIEAGYQVHIIDNLCNSERAMIDRISELSGAAPSFDQVDIRDSDALSLSLSRHDDAAGVIHFAALKSVGESVKQPIQYYKNNVLGTCNLIAAMQQRKINNLVFSSSATVYGSPDQLPVTEQSPIGYTPSPYGATKQMCERIIEDSASGSADMCAMSLRYFNPTGAHASHLIGELPTGIPNNLMPYITQTAAKLRDQLSVFGSDYNTHDGTAVRDYIHVSDVAIAHVRALEYLTKHNNTGHTKLNIGTGVGLSVLEVIKSFEKTSGQKLKYVLAPRREGDIEAVYANVSLAQSLLGWTAKYTIDEMTSSAWAWEKELRGIAP